MTDQPQTQSEPQLDIKPPSSGRRILRVAIQLIGFAVGLASLAFCVSVALRPENREQLNKLAEAPASTIALLLALSIGSIITSGLMFWVQVLPYRRLPVADVVATNGICSFLGYLPMKAGAIVRVLIHNRRDGIPVLTIGAWFVAVAMIMAVVFVPAVGGLLLLGPLTIVSGAIIALGIAVIGAALVLTSRAFAGQRGQDRLVAIAERLRLRPLRTFLRSGFWAKLHAGFDMLASPGVVAAAILLRILDAALQAARFIVAAGILGLNLPAAQAIPISVTFFIVGVVSPGGQAGIRDASAAGLAAKLVASAGATGASFEQFAPVALLVTATEAVAYLATATAGLAWLRPHRLLSLRTAPTPPA